MRILYLSPWFPYPLDTGFRNRVYHLLKALSCRHQVVLITLNPSGWAPAQLDPVAPFCEQVAIIPADPFHRSCLRNAVRFLCLRPVADAPIADLASVACRLHADDPFDVAISASTVMSPYVFMLDDLVRILEEHNSHTRWMLERYRAQESTLRRLRCWASWRKSRLYESRLLPRFDLITMVSEQDAETSRLLLPSSYPPVAIVPNGADCVYNSLYLKDVVPHTLVYNGALAYPVNCDAMRYFLAEIYPLIQERVHDVSLTITGSTSGASLGGLQIDSTVHLSGYVKDVRPLVASAGVCIVPLRDGGGTRLKILEAMALGTPVVATSKGAEGLEIVDRKHILIANDPCSFANCVIQLLTNDVLRKKLVSSARALVESKYDWSNIGRHFLELVENLVEKESSVLSH